VASEKMEILLGRDRGCFACALSGSSGTWLGCLLKMLRLGIYPLLELVAELQLPTVTTRSIRLTFLHQKAALIESRQ
jgi:hypothetical protein